MRYFVSYTFSNGFGRTEVEVNPGPIKNIEDVYKVEEYIGKRVKEKVIVLYWIVFPEEQNQ